MTRANPNVRFLFTHGITLGKSNLPNTIQLLDMLLGTNMTVYNWSALTNNQSINFSGSSDQLNFDLSTISASSVLMTWTSTTIVTFTCNGQSVTLTGTDVKSLTTTNLIFANGSVFAVGDNTVGLSADDSANTLIGSAQNDSLLGLGGNDTISAGAGDDVILVGYNSLTIGNDSIDGGSGSDRLVYVSNNSSTPAVTANLATHTATSSQGILTLTSIERIYGTLQNDTFLGGDPSHATDGSGNSSTEVFRGNGGNDTITGGSPANFRTAADYSNNASTQGIIANLGTGVVTDGLGGTDTISNVQQIWGGAGQDQFIGGDPKDARDTSGNIISEVFRGGGGDDTITGALAPNYRTIADYITSSQAIKANLSIGTVSDGLGGTDTISNVQWIWGGAGNDQIIGGDPKDAIDALGNGNYEIFRGNAGNDAITGGAGVNFNTVSDYSNDASNQVVIANLQTGLVIDGLGGIDTLTNVSRIWGG